ncbi:cytochrome b N-terminal domain-containing protein [Salinirubrum litoreum]|uniref:Cytochrome b N-terminal domain-containing protein n=1 Tax=Salinirubrum litoreum TaxID=1126234 RepID=A0ABD5RED9_9EURY|nr:cytochrome b N-terminal domain-containing protein [Salinirubrum litoreum]
MPSPDSDDTPSLLPTLAVALVALVVGGDLLLLALPAPDALRHLLVGSAVLAGVLVVAVGVRRSPTAGVAALLVLPPVGVYAYTGLLLPWTRLSFWVGQTLVELTLTVPVVGGVLAQLLFAGVTLSQATLERAFVLHYAVVALAGLACCGAAAPTLARRLAREN